MTAPDDSSAAARWRRLVTGRLDEMSRLSPGAGSMSGSFWEGRADRCAKDAPVVDPAKDPLLRRLGRVSEASSTVIDVGAGTGRHALALAAGVRRVTAVEPSQAMVAVLRRHAEQLAVTNLTAIQASWEEADVEPADVAYSSFVLTLVADAVPFLAKLDAVARRRVVLYLGAYSSDALIDPLWRHFHDVPRAPAPTYLDAIAVLRERGIEPAVKIVDIPDDRRFATIEEAAEHYREWMFLDDTPAVRRELEELLKAWLMGRRGALRSPLRSMTAAILDWRPRTGA